ADVLAAGESVAIRRSRLDDHSQRGVVHTGVPPYDLAYPTSAPRYGKAIDSTGQTIVRGRARRAPLEVGARADTAPQLSHIADRAHALDVSWVGFATFYSSLRSPVRSCRPTARGRRHARAAWDQASRRRLARRAAWRASTRRGTDRAATCRCAWERKRPRRSPSTTADRAVGSPGGWARQRISAHGRLSRVKIRRAFSVEMERWARRRRDGRATRDGRGSP